MQYFMICHALILFFLFFSSGIFAVEKPVIAGSGAFILPAPAFLAHKDIKLSGNWEFYYNRFLPSSYFIHRTEVPDGFIQVPGSWMGFTIHGQKISGFGYATYRTVLSNSVPGEHYALSIYAVGTAYNVFIDGDFRANCGVPGTNISSTRGQIMSKVVTFTAKTNFIEVLFHVANYQDKSGGFWRAMYFGREEVIQRHKTGMVVLELLLIGIMLLGGLLQLILFAIDRTNKAFLYFGLFCLFISMRTLIEGEWFFTQMFPEISLEIVFKILFIATYFSFALFALYIHSVFSKITFVWPIRLAVLIFTLYTIIVLLTSMRVYTFGVYVLNGFIILYAVYFLFVYAKALYLGQKGALLSLIVAFFLVLTVLNDALHAMMIIQSSSIIKNTNIIQSSNVIPIGLFAFLIHQNIQLTLLYARLVRMKDTVPVLAEADLEGFMKKYDFTKREREILALQITGKTNEMIAEELFISVSTVKKHIHSIYQKSGANNKIELVRLIHALNV